MLKISENIEIICNKNKILYKSPYHENIKQTKIDAQQLAKIYTDLKIISSDLESIKKCYPELKNELDIDTFDLEKISHHLINEAQKILRLEKLKVGHD